MDRRLSATMTCKVLAWVALAASTELDRTTLASVEPVIPRTLVAATDGTRRSSKAHRADLTMDPHPANTARPADSLALRGARAILKVRSSLIRLARILEIWKRTTRQYCSDKWRTLYASETENMRHLGKQSGPASIF